MAYHVRGRKPITNTKVLSLINEALEVFKSLNVELKKIDGWVEFKASSKYGEIEYNGDRVRIGLNSLYYHDEKGLYNTILHELVHAAKCVKYGHGESWKRLAYVVSKATGTVIKRTGEARSTREPERETKVSLPKFACKCSSCGKTFFRFKESNFTLHPAKYRSACCHAPIEIKKLSY